jgi:Tfp pilus assembly protein PilF
MLLFKSRLLVLPALLLVAVSVTAQRDRDTYNPGNQSFEVSGQVNLADSDAPAHDVAVRLERFTGGVVDQINTDSRGRFRFTNLQRGYYKVVISAPGFGSVQQDADLTLLFKTYLVFTLVSNQPRALSNLMSPTGVIDARVPAEARNEFDRGRAALAKKDQREAITHLQKAVTLHPSFFDADFLLATAYVDMREWSKAEVVLQRALELKPDSAPALVSLGEVYWRQKRAKESEEALLAGLKLDERSWHGYFTLARLYWDQDNIAKAAPAIGHTLQLKPDFAEGHLLAGNILLKINQQQRALAEYQEYLRLEPKGEFAVQTRELVAKLKQAKGQ